MPSPISGPVSGDELIEAFAGVLSEHRSAFAAEARVTEMARNQRLDGLERRIAEVKTATVGLHRAANSSRSSAPPAATIMRGLAVQFVAAARKTTDTDAVAAALYPGRDNVKIAARDPGAFWQARTATNPANTTTAGWAAELADTRLGPITSFAPASAYSQLAARAGLRISFDEAGNIRLPIRQNTASQTTIWIGEGAPIPVKALNFSAGVIAVPHKIGVMSLFSKELSRHSPLNIEAVIRAGLAEDLTVELDGCLFDAQPATALRPAGLLAGVIAIAAGTATDLASRLGGTLSALAAAISPASNIVYVTSPADLQSIAVVAPAVLSSFVASGSLPAGRIVAVDIDAFYVAEGDPAFDVAEEALLHADSVPAAIVGDPTAPPALADVATPVRSLFQTASVGIRLLSALDFGTRRPGAIAFVADWRA
ncbi:phage major capsid protein [Mesorhizobium sp. CN2-181]|uniref:phage major capsid protein n=1 Tax=Mesorhizobium yinganensis TaxID=3157707 RepID=UPI0032B77BC0